ncbi:MAG: efflux RND transporter periplasmic adaptor subunit [Lewinellaceae bacterium]|nr:efflux RND transporter periplasmic adaptor subunit [Lewinellaceae bacterium]
MKTISNFFFALLLPGLLVGALACSRDASPGEVSAEISGTTPGIRLTTEQMELAGVEVGQISRRMMNQYLECTGQIEVPPQNRASIHSPIQGFVQDVRYLEGDFVQKGAVLANLSHPDLIRLQRELLESKGRLQWLEQELARKETLVEGDAIARKEQAKAASDYQIEKAHYNGIKAELNMIGLPVTAIENGEIQQVLPLKAPVSGFITGIHTHLGELVQPGKPLYEMVDPGHIHLELQVFAKDAINVRPGQAIECWVPGLEEHYRAEVHLIGREIDQDTKTVQVHGHFAKDPAQLLPGTYVQGKITTVADSIWAVPQSAIVLENGKPVLYFQKGDYFEAVEVETGIQDGEYIAVRVPADLQKLPLVLRGAYYLKGTSTGAEE